LNDQNQPVAAVDSQLEIPAATATRLHFIVIWLVPCADDAANVKTYPITGCIHRKVTRTTICLISLASIATRLVIRAVSVTATGAARKSGQS
jgi:hypothetical protein